MKDLFGQDVPASREARSVNNRKAAERQAEWRKTSDYRRWVIESRERRRQLKEKYRRQKGIKTREQLAAEREASILAKCSNEKLHMAHVMAYWVWRKEQPWYADYLREKNKDRNLKRYRKMANDIQHLLNQRLRVAIRKALRGNKAGRRWESIVGYALGDLVKHLSRQLPNGITLDAALKKGWHIDHIVPKSTYELANEDDLKSAWCLSNLRLIPAKENIRKSDKREFLI